MAADDERLVAGTSQPGRPRTDLFDRPAEVAGLTDDQAAAVAEARRLTAALGELHYDGTGLACIAGIGAAEAARRLEATVKVVDREEFLDQIDPFDQQSLAFVGVTDVPGGCVVTQPWGYMPTTPGATRRLSAGTLCYAMFANPKSGNQGVIVRDGQTVGGDHPGGTPWGDAGPVEVL
ncbi:ankyrin repeat domain-containing protein, partial [Sphaerisporangium album]